MTEDKCHGTCMFHEQYERKVDTVYDWHLGEIERRITMQKSIDDMTRWFRRLVFAIAVGVTMQVLIPVVKAALA